MRPSKLSTLADCLDQVSVDRLRHQPKFLLTVSSDNGVSQRKFARVELVDGTPALADAVTGTLYSPEDGRCFTSTRMRVIL